MGGWMYEVHSSLVRLVSSDTLLHCALHRQRRPRLIATSPAEGIPQRIRFLHNQPNSSKITSFHFHPCHHPQHAAHIQFENLHLIFLFNYRLTMVQGGREGCAQYHVGTFSFAGPATVKCKCSFAQLQLLMKLGGGMTTTRRHPPQLPQLT